MAIYKITQSCPEKALETTSAERRLKDRDDLQRRFRNSIEVVALGTIAIAEEFRTRKDSKGRLALLVSDSSINLVDYSSKRTQDGTHMESQALRCAPMV